MRKTTLALLSLPPAVAAAGLATRLDGLASLGVIATMACAFAVRTRRRPQAAAATRRGTSLSLAAGWAVMTAVDLREPGAPLSHVLGIATWQLVAAACAFALVDAAGLPDLIEARTAAMQTGARATRS